jgi:hypothetical protein
MVMLIDLSTGEVLSVNPLSEKGWFQMAWDGDDIVVTSDEGGIWTLSPPYKGFFQSRTWPDVPMTTLSANGSSGWCHIDLWRNVTVMNGTPREEVLAFDMTPGWPVSAAWTGVPGDLVLGSMRYHGGSTLQLWRLGGGEDDGWRSVGGAWMVTGLNSSRIVKQVEADPAFPGLVAVLFEDGTLALYHLNLTPYPAAPEELGGLPIDPYIPPPDDVNGTDGLPWGSEWDWVFPVALATVLVVVMAVAVVLRARRGSGED